MSESLDLRDHSAETRRHQLFEALTDASPGTELTILADDDLDPALVRYQIEQNRSLAVDHATPDGKPREHHVTVLDESVSNTDPAIDVRDLIPQRRHDVLTRIFAELEADEGFVLVNDHDPKPLYHELRASHDGAVGWEYRQRDNGEYRVHIEKTAESPSNQTPEATRFDLREIPDDDRESTILHRLGMLPAGETMELLAESEPEDLREAITKQYPTIRWSVVESGTELTRINVTTGESGDDEISVTQELDVRDLPPAKRHELIFDAYEKLSLGEGFVLVNDHDPKPLYHQFDAEAGPEFQWTYRQQEPGEFRVLIGKAQEADSPAEDEPSAPL